MILKDLNHHHLMTRWGLAIEIAFGDNSKSLQKIKFNFYAYEKGLQKNFNPIEFGSWMGGDEMESKCN